MCGKLPIIELATRPAVDALIGAVLDAQYKVHLVVKLIAKILHQCRRQVFGLHFRREGYRRELVVIADDNRTGCLKCL